MARFAAGDRSAFDAVFEALWPRMLQLTRRMLRTEADAQDAAQAALLKVFSRMSDYDPTRDGLAWALGIAAYEARTIARRASRKREQGIDSAAEMPDGQLSAEQALIAHEERAALAEILGTIPAEERALVTGGADDPSSGAGAVDARTRKRKQRVIDRLRDALRGRTRGDD